MAFLRWTVVAVLFVALFYLALQNSDKVTLTLFNVAKWEAPLVVVVFTAFACGVAAGLLAGALRAARLKRQVNKLRREQRASGERLPLPAGAAPGTAPGSGPGFTRADRLPEL
jgi:uncharacterized integral membrane protein